MKKDNKSLYINDLYFTLKTVNYFLLLIVLVAKINLYVLAKPLKRVPARGRLFLKGLMYALKRRFRPVNITSTVSAKENLHGKCKN